MMVKNEELRKYKIISAVLLVLLAATVVYSFGSFSISEQIADVTLPQLSTEGFAKVDKITVRPFGNVAGLLLTSGCYELSASVEVSQGISIQNALDNKFEARPNAHDIAKDVFNSLGIKVLQVKITEQKGNSYFAKMVVRQKNTVLNLDARPSDAMAIALRVDAPTYINETLLKQNGENIC